MLSQIIHRELVWFYPWLRRMAGALMASERRSHTLQPTALANEVLAKLLAWKGDLSKDTEKSLRLLAVTVARQTLIDHGRRFASRRRHLTQIRDEQRACTVPSEAAPLNTRVTMVLEAIESLKTIDPQLSDLVRLRFLEGYTHQQATRMLGMSPRTAARRWAFAKAFLAEAISREEDNLPYDPIA
ncbi:MAG: ECF-type sigma factor [Pirellula sp.]|jgi:RNA polymerase sigma factor (TIGR02999 family)|nr:ECF-type sigma factor [Pirellula sp.]